MMDLLVNYVFGQDVFKKSNVWVSSRVVSDTEAEDSDPKCPAALSGLVLSLVKRWSVCVGGETMAYTSDNSMCHGKNACCCGPGARVMGLGLLVRCMTNPAGPLKSGIKYVCLI